MGRPREHDETTRRALVDAADRLLAAEGVEALTVRRVADEVGTTTRAVYSVLGSKEGLVSALYRRSFERLMAAVDAVPTTDDPLADLVSTGTEGFRAYALAYPHLFKLVFERLARDVQPSAEDRAVAEAAFGRLVARVQRCIDASLLPGANARRTAMQFHAACQGLAQVELLGWTSQRPAELWRETLGALVEGLALAAGRSRARTRTRARPRRRSG